MYSKRYTGSTELTIISIISECFRSILFSKTKSKRARNILSDHKTSCKKKLLHIFGSHILSTDRPCIVVNRSSDFEATIEYTCSLYFHPIQFYCYSWSIDIRFLKILLTPWINCYRCRITTPQYSRRSRDCMILHRLHLRWWCESHSRKHTCEKVFKCHNKQNNTINFVEYYPYLWFVKFFSKNMRWMALWSAKYGNLSERCRITYRSRACATCSSLIGVIGRYGREMQSFSKNKKSKKLSKSACQMIYRQRASVRVNNNKLAIFSWNNHAISYTTDMKQYVRSFAHWVSMSVDIWATMLSRERPRYIKEQDSTPQAGLKRDWEAVWSSLLWALKRTKTSWKEPLWSRE